MKKIIAFDLGKTFAYATNLFEDDPTFCQKITRKDGMIREHWLAEVFAFVNDTLHNFTGQLDAAIYERPFARGQAATRSLWGTAGIIEAVCTMHGLPVVDMPPSSIKKWAVGKGNADKAEMTAAAQIMGYMGDDEHEADAVCLLRYAEANIETVKREGEDDGGQDDGCDAGGDAEAGGETLSGGDGEAAGDQPKLPARSPRGGAKSKPDRRKSGAGRKRKARNQA